MTRTARLHSALSASRHALLIGVGGGNDSVTTLLLREQLRRDYDFAPEGLDIAAMMPDFLEYRHYDTLPCHERLWRLRPESERWFQGTRVAGFPEPLLAGAADHFAIGAVYGIDMRAGAEGVYQAFHALIQANQYDLVLACDIGGDFIAAPQNVEVLSPMMDAYALHALRRLDTPEQGASGSCRFVYAVFGLGTDGESSPEMLRQALENVGDYEARRFYTDIAPEVERFYREVVEPRRYSRTADFTLRQIRGVEMHAPVEGYRVRLHTRPSPRSRRSYTGAFEHAFDPAHYGHYYLFDHLEGIDNPFCVPCRNAVEWFVQVSDSATRVHHELVGQAASTDQGLVNFATTSRKFPETDRPKVLADTISALRTGVYDAAFVYHDDVVASPSLLGEDLHREEARAGLLLLSRGSAPHLSRYGL